MPTLTYMASRLFLRAIFRCTGGLEVRGRENTPADGPLIVAANHASYLDPMILGAAFSRDLHFMARKTLFDVPLFGAFIRWNQAFPLDRDGGDSREAIRAFGELLGRNFAVVMFPEGTRSPDGAIGPVKTGVGMLAIRNQAPVTPVYIWGGYQSWPRGRRFPSPHRLKVIVGNVIRPSGDKSIRKEEQQRITREVDMALHELEREAWRGEGEAPSGAAGAARWKKGDLPRS